MNLTPNPCECSDHGHDLTDLVRDAIKSKVPVSSYGVLFGRKRERKKNTFTVIVTCPGPEGGEKTHPVRFQGTYT